MKNEKKKVVGIKELARLVSEQESDISAIETKLEDFEGYLDDKAAQSDLSDLEYRVSEIEDNVNDDNAKVEMIDELVEKVEELQSAHAVIEEMQSTIDSYCDKVNKLETLVKPLVAVDPISDKVNKLETLVKLLITKLPDSVLVALVGEKCDLKWYDCLQRR